MFIQMLTPLSVIPAEAGIQEFNKEIFSSIKKKRLGVIIRKIYPLKGLGSSFRWNDGIL
jgi:hypothetical protein